MTITNSQSGTRVHEIARGIHRISTPVRDMPGGFTFNQFLVVDDAPLLFHTGPRRMFPLVREAVAHVLGDVARLRYVAFSHIESDECGSMNDFLAAAPAAEAVFSTIGAMTSSDLADRPPVVLADGQELDLGGRRLRWLDAPHLPHNWETGYLFDSSTRTLLCGDLFTHGGADLPAITESEVLGPSEALRAQMNHMAVERDGRRLLEKLARTEPGTLAIMHGSSYRGDGGKLLRALADALGV
jgi:flavorubredoxin